MNGIEIFNNIWPWVVIAVIIALGFTTIMFLIMTALFMPAFLQKKINLRRSENILQSNLEIVEKATFFETSSEFNKLIETQKETIRNNAAKIKSQEAQIEVLNKEKSRAESK